MRNLLWGSLKGLGRAVNGFIAISETELPVILLGIVYDWQLSNYFESIKYEQGESNRNPEIINTNTKDQKRRTTNQIMINEVPKLSFRSPPRWSQNHGEFEAGKWVSVGCRRDPLRRIIGKPRSYCNEYRTRTKRDEKSVVDTKTDHECPYARHVGVVPAF